MRKTTQIPKKDNTPPRQSIRKSQNFAKSQPVPKKKISPAKKAKSLSELTPVQFFQKKFGELEVHFHELKKYNPPNGSDSFFQTFVNFKSLIPSFSQHASKILKQRVLSAPLNPKSFEACSAFREEVPLFIQSIHKYHHKIMNLYYKSIFGYFIAMTQNFDYFSSVCFRDPHTRNIMAQYEDSCRDALKKIEITLKSFFDPSRFATITTDESLNVAENIKTLARFFMFDLQRILGPYLTPTNEIASFYSKFKSAFLQLVPMLSAIPSFRDEFEILLSKIEPMKNAFERLVKYIGDTPDAIKIKKKPALTGGPVELIDEDLDPYEEPLEKFSEFLNVKFEKDQNNVQKFAISTQNAIETISNLRSDLERAKKRLNVLEPMNSKEAIIDRFEQIRIFKTEFTKQEEKIRNDFMRNLIYQIKALTKDLELDVNESYPKQIRLIITEISEDLTNKENEISGLKKQIEESNAILSQITQNSDNESLPQTVNKVMKSYRESQKEINDLNNKVKSFLKNEFPKESNSKFDSFNIDDSLKFIKENLNEQKKEIDNLKNHVSKLEKSKTAFKKETTDVLEFVYTKLNIMNNCINHEFNQPKDLASLKLSDLRDNIKITFNKQIEKQEDNNKRLMEFLVKALTVLKLPTVNFADDGEEAYNNAMNSILDSISIPTKADLFINNTANDSQSNKNVEFREFLLDICVRITQKPKNEFNEIDNEKLKQVIFENLEKLLNRTDLSKFNEYLPKTNDLNIVNTVTKQLQTAKAISEFSTKIQEDKELKEINDELTNFLKNRNDWLSNEVKEGFSNLSNIIDQNYSQISVSDMKKQVDNLQKFISNKDQQIKEITDKMKDCQKHFFEYVDAIKKKSENHQDLLQEMQNNEIQTIVDFFTQVDANDDYF
ncbi:hypothetical protein TRFO_35137 [Tritrichomonas foetus]|uniref:Uncharacterized protein n=1 Tax=Tritrichomonas foetus TaxID=1144522 RepID=A0A1J4JJE7_9EUKA|nr:hypothetical protein TRFO_35137 [Tritrichomonas foetus]|eukprot:OHS98463.1 hypothetical protein TRFO_35137 [Tritrichomonas foetus]